MQSLLRRPANGANDTAIVGLKALVILSEAKDLVLSAIRRFARDDRLWPVATPQLIRTRDDDGNS